MPPVRAALLLFATSFTLLGTGCVAVAVHAARAGIDSMPRPECPGFDSARSGGDALIAEAKRLKAGARIPNIAMVEAQQEGAIHELRLKSLCEALRSNDITQQQYQESFDKAGDALRLARATLATKDKAYRPAPQASATPAEPK